MRGWLQKNYSGKHRKQSRYVGNGAYNKEANPSPLRGKVKCGCCGYSMSLKRAVKKQYYYCRMGNGCGS